MEGELKVGTTPLYEEAEHSCRCGAREKLIEVLRVNHQWGRDYDVLRKECERMREVEEKFKRLRTDFEEMRNMVGAMEKTENGNTSEDIEALKLQLNIYKEDLVQQKEECEKSVERNKNLKMELHKASEIIDKLTHKNKKISECYFRVRSEKDHILKELRRLSSLSSPTNYDVKVPDHRYMEIIRREDLIPPGAPRLEVTRIDVPGKPNSK